MNRWSVRVCCARGLCVLVVLSQTAPEAAAITIQVAATGFTSLDNGVTQTPIDVQHELLPGGAEKISGIGSIGGQTGGNPPLFEYSAGVTGFAQAGPGTLKARVAGSAVAASFVPNVPAVIYTPRAVGNFGASYFEYVELTHPTLPVGAPVEFQVSLEIDYYTNDPAYFPVHAPFALGRYPTGTFALQFAAGSQIGINYFFPNSLFQSVREIHYTHEWTGSGLVGDLVPIYTSLGVGADDRAGPFDGTLQNYGREQHTVIDASNTIHTYLDAITPGLGFRSESGHDYRSNAVPEPGAVWLALMGLATTTVRPCVYRRRTN